MSREEMLGRITRRKGDSSDSGTLFEPVSGSVDKPLPKIIDKAPHEKGRLAGVGTRLRSRTPVIDVDNHVIYLAGGFLFAEGTNNGIWFEAERLLFPVAKERLSAMDAPNVLDNCVQMQLQNRSAADLNEYENHAIKAEQERSTLQVELARINDRLSGLREENLKLIVESRGLTMENKELKKRVLGFEDEVKYQEAEITVKVKAAMANKFLSDKFKDKEQTMRTLVDDYLLIGNIKDLELEDEKDDGVDATVSAAESDPQVVPLNILPPVSQKDNMDDIAGQ